MIMLHFHTHCTLVWNRFPRRREDCPQGFNFNGFCRTDSKMPDSTTRVLNVTFNFRCRLLQTSCSMNATLGKRLVCLPTNRGRKGGVQKRFEIQALSMMWLLMLFRSHANLPSHLGHFGNIVTGITWRESCWMPRARCKGS